MVVHRTAATGGKSCIPPSLFSVAGLPKAFRRVEERRFHTKALELTSTCSHRAHRHTALAHTAEAAVGSSPPPPCPQLPVLGIASSESAGCLDVLEELQEGIGI